ncbi:MAG: DUF87 domain-containing protein [Thermoprotei archaeon]
MSSTKTPIGRIYRWSGGKVDVVITSDSYRPGIGDFLYVKTGDTYTILQVIGYEGEIPAPPTSLSMGASTPPIYGVSMVKLAKAEPFLEIRTISGKRVVVKPTQPPQLDSPVYLVRGGDPESAVIMESISRGISVSGDAIPVAWLRSGIASIRELQREIYFREAAIRLDLKQSVPKHILVAGATGSGKTTSVMGMMAKWAKHGDRGLSWLVIDRHGEYVPPRGNELLYIMSKLMDCNENLREAGIYIYALRLRRSDKDKDLSVGARGRIVENPGAIDASTISLEDIVSSTDLSVESISELEEIVSLLISLFKTISEENILDQSWVSVFVRNDEPTGNLVALIPLVIDNIIRYEGIGEKEKKGLYSVILRVGGVNIHKLRRYRRVILSTLGLRIRTTRVRTSSGSVVDINVLDDTHSIFKVSEILKDGYALVKLMKSLVEAMRKRGIAPASYQWRSVSGEPQIRSIRSGNIRIDDIVDNVNGGNVVIVDVSKIPTEQGDVVVMSILRRLFENRINIGVEESSKLPRVAIVSEEAPLYLSPDKVGSPYNVFARIAREGRKFGLGLIAISQLATMIERQILANFNTVIALRTKYISDIRYFEEIGVPGETLPSLGDREGYIYTPDLSVREPIPVYFPAYFDYKDELEESCREGEEVSWKKFHELLGDSSEDIGY